LPSMTSSCRLTLNSRNCSSRSVPRRWFSAVGSGPLLPFCSHRWPHERS
jgi:hypothetical protein